MGQFLFFWLSLTVWRLEEGNIFIRRKNVCLSNITTILSMDIYFADYPIQNSNNFQLEWMPAILIIEFYSFCVPCKTFKLEFRPVLYLPDRHTQLGQDMVQTYLKVLPYLYGVSERFYPIESLGHFKKIQTHTSGCLRVIWTWNP